MARILILDEERFLWHILAEVLESEGYIVCMACNDYEGLPPPRTGLIAITPRTIQYVVAF